MPRLTIDDLEIEVPEGTKVIEAAERLGIMVPRFCFHPGLGSVGACRMCAVKFLQGPFKGLQMSCMVDAKDGMVVSTTDPEAIAFRKYVIEWLMLNHPHDCPVCDEGGHCLLQDETISGGHGNRRYLGKKRTYRDQDLGVFVQHEMNRCIHCYRCRRFYQDFAGYRDLGAMQIANRVYFGRYSDGPLESPFAGNLIDVCPTGVYTDKPARYKGRRWDFQRGPSLCIHCSLGCHTVTSARYREVVRQEGRFCAAVNGYFICDRGRYGFYYATHPKRPRRPLIDREEVDWEHGIGVVAEQLTRLVEQYGGASIASLGSARCSLETQAMLNHLCRQSGWRPPAFFVQPWIQRKVKRAVSRLDQRLAVSLREIEGADLVLAVGVDPVNEAPMLALAMRQAVRAGATVIVLDPRPVFLPFEFDRLAMPPWEMDLCLRQLLQDTVTPRTAAESEPAGLLAQDPLPGVDSERLSQLKAKLRQCQRPIIVCGTDIVRDTIPALLADSALALRDVKERSGLFYVLPGANAFGASLVASEEHSFVDTIEAIENGTVKALLVVESDPLWSFPDRLRLEQALEQLDLLVVLDYLPSPLVERTRVFLPTSTMFETRTCFINQEGRAQMADAIEGAGIPISQVSGGSHPPRVFRDTTPGGEVKPAWRVLADLLQALAPAKTRITQDDLWSLLAQTHPAFAKLDDETCRSEGQRLIPEVTAPEALSQHTAFQEQRPPAGHLELLLVDWTFGTEELSSYSSHIRQAEKAPCLVMHLEDAANMGLANDDKATLHLDGGQLEVNVRVSSAMARGTLVLPRHHRLDWQKVRQYPIFLDPGQITRSS